MKTACRRVGNRRQAVMGVGLGAVEDERRRGRRHHRSAGRDRGYRRNRRAGQNGPGKAERHEGRDDGPPYAHVSSMAYVLLSSLHLASAARGRIDTDVLLFASVRLFRVLR